MEFLSTLPVWALAIVIFLLRVFDVTFGTLRTLAVVQGRVYTSVALGFVEVLVWVTAVAQVIEHASSNPLLLLAYAGGFAAGNATGIFVERWLALGGVILRIISRENSDRLAASIRDRVSRVYYFNGAGEAEAITLLYVVVRRRDARALIEHALSIDPDLFYAVDLLRESNLALVPPGGPTGWRSVLKKK